jgi:hypothetical protein
MHFIDKRTILLYSRVLKVTDEHDFHCTACIECWSCGSHPPMSFPLVIFHPWSLPPLGERPNG